MITKDLVLIPGLASDAAVWRRTIEALDGRARCRVGDTLSDDTLTEMARRVLNTAPQRFALAGVSMGGMVAMEVMRLAPERVSRLALVDTTARPDTVARSAFRLLASAAVRLAGDYSRLAERNVATLVHPSAVARTSEELTEMGVRVGPARYLRQNRAVARRGDQRGILQTIRVPVSVIVGENDRVTPLPRSREIQALTPGAVLHVIPDCGHLPPIEQPEIVATLLEELLTRSSVTLDQHE